MSLEGLSPHLPSTNLGLVARSLIECGAFQPPFEDLFNTALSLVSPYKSLQPHIKRDKAIKARTQKKSIQSRHSENESGHEYVDRGQAVFDSLPERASPMKRSITVAKMQLDLKNHPQIQNSMHFHWLLLCPDSSGKCNKSDFVAALTRWYVAIVPGIDHVHAEKMANIECNVTRRRGFTAEMFFEKLFQITHNWCHTLNPAEYCNFLSLLFHRIAVGDMQTMSFNWKPIDKVCSLTEDEHLDPSTVQLPFRNQHSLSDVSAEEPAASDARNCYTEDAIDRVLVKTSAASIPESAMKLSDQKGQNEPRMIKLNSAFGGLRSVKPKRKTLNEKARPLQGLVKPSTVLQPFDKSNPKLERDQNPQLTNSEGDFDKATPALGSDSESDLGENSNKKPKKFTLAMPISCSEEAKLQNHNERLKRRIRKATRNEQVSSEIMQVIAERQRLLVVKAMESINWTQVLMSQQSTSGKMKRNKTLRIKTTKKGRRKQTARGLETRKAKKPTKGGPSELDLGIQTK